MLPPGVLNPCARLADREGRVLDLNGLSLANDRIYPAKPGDIGTRYRSPGRWLGQRAAPATEAATMQVA
jgi:hypothetical protein